MSLLQRFQSRRRSATNVASVCPSASVGSSSLTASSPPDVMSDDPCKNASQQIRHAECNSPSEPDSSRYTTRQGQSHETQQKQAVTKAERQDLQHTLDSYTVSAAAIIAASPNYSAKPQSPLHELRAFHSLDTEVGRRRASSKVLKDAVDSCTSDVDTVMMDTVVSVYDTASGEIYTILVSATGSIEDIKRELSNYVQIDTSQQKLLLDGIELDSASLITETLLHRHIASQPNSSSSSHAQSSTTCVPPVKNAVSSPSNLLVLEHICPVSSTSTSPPSSRTPITSPASSSPSGSCDRRESFSSTAAATDFAEVPHSVNTAAAMTSSASRSIYCLSTPTDSPTDYLVRTQQQSFNQHTSEHLLTDRTSPVVSMELRKQRLGSAAANPRQIVRSASSHNVKVSKKECVEGNITGSSKSNSPDVKRNDKKVVVVGLPNIGGRDCLTQSPRGMMSPALCQPTSPQWFRTPDNVPIVPRTTTSNPTFTPPRKPSLSNVCIQERAKDQTGSGSKKGGSNSRKSVTYSKTKDVRTNDISLTNTDALLESQLSSTTSLGISVQEEKRRLIQQNYLAALELNPEAFCKVVMLYIDMDVNGIAFKAFVDSGAQMTIMTERAAKKAHIDHLIDKRFHGLARGVGAAPIIGRIHMTQISVTGALKDTERNTRAPMATRSYSFGGFKLDENGAKTTEPAGKCSKEESLYSQEDIQNHGGLLRKMKLLCSFTIMADQDVDIILGLDMLMKHECVIDLSRHVVVIGCIVVPFLPEKDLPTKGTQT
eukprot:GHVQ01039689.1.p1 GENE.GHVQ01039689.1~~GHVQ01039689.1.p1  ORF type:complete len:770 (+),score=130.20 GHVQ01039689.1:3043-5352(+)